MNESIYSFLSGGGGFLPSLSTPTLPLGEAAGGWGAKD